MLLRHIRYFLAVKEHRNFTRAAEALHVSQPTLSQQIRQIVSLEGSATAGRDPAAGSPDLKFRLTMVGTGAGSGNFDGTRTDARRLPSADRAA
ncbi:regulatory helix-turn-helix protein, lysR family [Burkholderia sp. YR290]|jgi:uncharacterized membrane protein|nr:regulatory helix-turn-helix protein, lysR family [Paraburkholderia hospita]SOE89323.1 regulatory helix-turn-helix protein, lysR family [Burkholderia sp. YR290]